MVKGNGRSIADIVLLQSKYYSNSAGFWLGLQDDIDIKDETFAKEFMLKSTKAFILNVHN